MKPCALPLCLWIAVGCAPAGGVAVDAGGPPADVAPPDLESVPVDGGYLVPAGTTLTPFLSADPVRTFAAVGTAVMAGRDYFAILETDAGRIVLDLLDVETPVTVNSFVWLALHHFYDGVAFHRVINDFVAQAGDPNTLDSNRATWGVGGPGYHFGIEPSPALTFDGAGAVGMARATDPDSNGSQFYITLAAAHNLDGKYTLFAHVTEGLDVLPKLARGEPPASPTRMSRVYIADKAR
jgi:cyclophilin family peptidyl-prolyl cis-trans isomerase